MVFKVMEAQLAAYRARKRQEVESKQSFLSKFFLYSSKQADQPVTRNSAVLPEETDVKFDQESTHKISRSSVEQLQKGQKTVETNVIESSEPENNNFLSRNTSYITVILKVILWFTLWGFFIEIQFGAVYFILSLSFLLYLNTSTGPRGNRLSAYSVFNPNQERLDGTFTAEQFEKELRYGAGSVK